ncbi:MAG: hypothetical protein C0498_01400 [Anaerolinea sp.]|nr:hypothetical protein [Anaerolinea sp.]
MRKKAAAVRDELLLLGLDTSTVDPAEIEWVCEELAALAAKHHLPPRVVARHFAYARAVHGAAAAGELAREICAAFHVQPEEIGIAAAGPVVDTEPRG